MIRQITSASFVVGNSTTNVVNLNEYNLVGFSNTGSSISGSLISFLVSSDGTNFYPLINRSGNEITLTSGSISKSYALDPNDFMAFDYFKARLGTSGSSVLQTTVPATVEFIAKKLYYK